MALSVAGTATTVLSSANPTQSENINKPVGAAVGEILALAGAAAPAVIWTTPTGFSDVVTSATTGGRSLATYRRTVDGTEGATFTLAHDTASNTSLVGACLRIASDVLGATVALVTQATSDSGGASNATVTFSDVPIRAGDLVLRFTSANLAAASSVTMTQPASYIEQADGHSTNAAGARTQISVGSRVFASGTSTGAETGTLSASRPWQTVTMVFRESSYHPYGDSLRRATAAIAFAQGLVR